MIRATRSTYTLSVNVPPKIGPTTLATPFDKPKRDVNTGRFLRGISGSMMTMLPVKIPADAKPVIARPMIKDTDVGAAPQRAEPASKMMRDHRYTHFVEYS